jgi:hypothetical protein
MRARSNGGVSVVGLDKMGQEKAEFANLAVHWRDRGRKAVPLFRHLEK